MEFKESIGDWEVVEFTDKSAIKIFSKGFVLPICNIEYPHSQGSKYNAQLISNSKNMLNMLKRQRDFLVYCRDNMKVSRPVFNAKIMELEQLIKQATEL